MKKWLLLPIFSLVVLSGSAQEKTNQVDVFCGAELNYNDTDVNRLYNVLINLTPGVKWNMGDNWLLATQLSFAAINEGYDHRQANFRLSMATISKEWAFSGQHLRVAGGLYSRERYGLDVRWMIPVTSWLMLQANAGLTNKWYLSFEEQTFGGQKWTPTGIVGANVWIDKWTTEFRVSGGRYINKDYGVEGEVYCHFKHCTIGAFAQYHERYYSPYVRDTYQYAGGFRVVVMLPPYRKRPNKEIVIRPASNFRLTYNAQADGYSMKKYMTDPEENEREYQTKVKWGTGLYR